MKHEEHRLGVAEVNLVNRYLALMTPTDTAKLNAAIAEIDQLYGLDEVAFDKQLARLDFYYDASRLCIDCAEQILTKQGIQPKHDGRIDVKDKYYRFVDQNIKDNPRNEPWSCHHTPRHTRK